MYAFISGDSKMRIDKCLAESIHKYELYIRSIRSRDQNLIYQINGRSCLNCFAYGNKLDVNGVLVLSQHMDSNHRNPMLMKWPKFIMNMKQYDPNASYDYYVRKIVRNHLEYLASLGHKLCKNCIYCTKFNY